MPRALVALGANLGDVRATLRAAARALQELSDGPFAAASMWGSDPVDCPPGSPRFLNSAVSFRTSLGPVPLLDVLQALEARAGRVRGIVNAPRTLDLDLIDYGGLVIRTPRLTLPHPRAVERDFVLAPLAELDRNLRLNTEETVAELLSRVEAHNLDRLGPVFG